jgi:hypothetical protein
VATQSIQRGVDRSLVWWLSGDRHLDPAVEGWPVPRWVDPIQELVMGLFLHPCTVKRDTKKVIGVGARVKVKRLRFVSQTA